ncbi:MAG TPA: hypothetical protein VNF05_07995 [Acidimicrobiales bacterium]|nr:hypothetical protein [Acidimicrobiales bacterium]
MYAAIFSDLFVVIVLVVVLSAALPWWAVVDVASRPKGAFVSTGFSKRAWLSLLIGFTVFTFFVGLGIALYYVVRVHPKMERRSRADEFGTRLLRSTMVLLLVVVSLSLTYGVGRVKSLLWSPTPQVRVEGSLSGQCPTGSSAEGRTYLVLLTTGSSGRVVGVTTLAGTSGRDSFTFDVSPGTYRLTATSGSISRHWSLSYAWGAHPSAQILPIPVAMNVSVPVDC